MTEEHRVLIRLQSDETEARADCGCRLTIEDDGAYGGNPAFYQCPLHGAAYTMTEALMAVRALAAGEETCLDCGVGRYDTHEDDCVIGKVEVVLSALPS